MASGSSPAIIVTTQVWTRADGTGYWPMLLCDPERQAARQQLCAAHNHPVRSAKRAAAIRLWTPSF